MECGVKKVSQTINLRQRSGAAAMRLKMSLNGLLVDERDGLMDKPSSENQLRPVQISVSSNNLVVMIDGFRGRVAKAFLYLMRHSRRECGKSAEDYLYWTGQPPALVLSMMLYIN